MVTIVEHQVDVDESPTLTELVLFDVDPENRTFIIPDYETTNDIPKENIDYQRSLAQMIDASQLALEGGHYVPITRRGKEVSMQGFSFFRGHDDRGSNGRTIYNFALIEPNLSIKNLREGMYYLFDQVHNDRVKDGVVSYIVPLFASGALPYFFVKPGNHLQESIVRMREWKEGRQVFHGTLVKTDALGFIFGNFQRSDNYVTRLRVQGVESPALEVLKLKDSRREGEHGERYFHYNIVAHAPLSEIEDVGILPFHTSSRTLVLGKGSTRREGFGYHAHLHTAELCKQYSEPPAPKPHFL